MVRFPHGQFALAYADTRSAYLVLAARVRDACLAKHLTEETCQTAVALHREFQRLDQDIRKTIADPRREPDWERLAEVLGVVAGLAVKIAP